MTDTDLTGVWRTRSGSVVRVTGAVPGQLDRWAVTHPDDDEPSIHTGTFIHASWSRVPDAEPAEAEDEQLPDWCDGDLSHLPPAVSAPVLPSDVRDGDLLTGTLYGLPFTDWPVRRAEDRGYVYVGEWNGDHIGLSGAVGDSGWRWGRNITVTALKPAPGLLPWESNPGWYRGKRGSIDEGYAYLIAAPDPLPSDVASVADYERVAVIPWDLIEGLREPHFAGYPPRAQIQDILDAVDGVA
jgi:hypothetical protein